MTTMEFLEGIVKHNLEHAALDIVEVMEEYEFGLDAIDSVFLLVRAAMEAKIAVEKLPKEG